MKLRKLHRRKRAEWVLDYYAGGKRIRKWFKSRTAAEAKADALKEQKRTCGEAWVDLHPAERSDLMLLVDEARREHCWFSRPLATGLGLPSLGHRQG